MSADTAISARRGGAAVGTGARLRARFGSKGWAGWFLMPALLLILFVSIFPLVASFYMAFSKLTMTPAGFQLKEVGWLNFRKLITGSQQGRFLGAIGDMPADVVVLGVAVFALVAWLLLRPVMALPPGSTGAGRVRAGLPRVVAAAIAALVFGLLYLNLRLDGFGALGTTLIFVIFGVALQFLIGLALAAICYERLRGMRFFRAIFFIPFMITPVGIAYMTRMIADTQRGPISGLWSFFGLGEFSWATDPLAARIAVVLGDTWQWVPFMFILLTAALESLPTETREAAAIDGANRWQTFRHVTLPQLAPVAITLILIRMIEAFKIIDLPNVLTAGGPGTATESMALFGYITWRALDLGGSAAISYLMLIVVTLATIGLILGSRPVRSHR